MGGGGGGEGAGWVVFCSLEPVVYDGSLKIGQEIAVPKIKVGDYTDSQQNNVICRGKLYLEVCIVK